MSDIQTTTMAKSCPLNSGFLWKVMLFLGVMLFTTNFLYTKLNSNRPSLLLIHSKTFFFNQGGQNSDDTNLAFIREESAMEMIQRKMRLMHRATKKPVTKAPKLIDSSYNAEKIKRITSGLFESNLKNFADTENRIILAVVDEEYLNFAINFYQLSIKRHKLENFLFITLDDASEIYFKENQIPYSSFPFSAFLKKSTKASNFGTKSFNYKTNMKTAVMIQALKVGLNVLMVDVDVIFFKDPLPFLHCNNCSMLVQRDRQLYNSGFVFAMNNPYSKKVYDLTWNFFLKLQKSHDQSYFNMAIYHLQDEKSFFELQVLSKEQFPCGLFYFEHVHRPFENLPPCEECVLVHNNYIGSRAAKLYRLKENHLWMVDQGEYYSNTSAKYITYENPLELENTVEMEIEALKSAVVLAAKLNRLLILPSFHCCSCSPPQECSHPRYRCSLLSVLRVASFEWAFEGQYREHSFLKHPLVPPQLSNSTSPQLLVNDPWYGDKHIDPSGLSVYQPYNSTHQPSLDDVSTWLEQYQDYSVIKFHSLYNTKFHERVAVEDFKIKHLLFLMRNAFECAEYEQWEKEVLMFK